MERIEVSGVTVSPGKSVGQDPYGGSTVVWLRGEHDAATAVVVEAALREAISLDCGDVVIDLSGIQFMGAAMIGVVVQAEQVLRAHSRALRLRRPTRCALRLVELCDLERMLEVVPDIAHATGPAGALASWVTVPHSAPVYEPGEGADVATKPPPVAPRERCSGSGSNISTKLTKPLTELWSTAPRNGF